MMLRMVLTILCCLETCEGLLSEEVVTFWGGHPARVERITAVWQLIRPADIASDTIAWGAWWVRYGSIIKPHAYLVWRAETGRQLIAELRCWPWSGLTVGKTGRILLLCKLWMCKYLSWKCKTVHKYNGYCLPPSMQHNYTVNKLHCNKKRKNQHWHCGSFWISICYPKVFGNCSEHIRMA